MVCDARMAEEFLSYLPITIKSGCLEEDAESRLRGKGSHD